MLLPRVMCATLPAHSLSYSRGSLQCYPVHPSLFSLPLPRDLYVSSLHLTLIPTESMPLISQAIGICVSCTVPCWFPAFSQKWYGSSHRCLEAEGQTEKYQFECMVSYFLLWTNGHQLIVLFLSLFSSCFCWGSVFQLNSLEQLAKYVMLLTVYVCLVLVFSSKVLVLLVLMYGAESWWYLSLLYFFFSV